MKKAYAALLTCCLILAIFPLKVQAIGFKISPIRFEIEATPGQSVEKILKVENKGPRANTEFLVQDFLGRNESGAPIFVENELDGDVSKFTLSSWIQFPEEVAFDANEKKEIEFVIKVPDDAEPGGHYASIFVQQKSGDIGGGSSVGTISRVGALIFVKVLGETVESGIVKDFYIPEESISDDKVVFVTLFENTGNVHLTPTGRIYIQDKDGNPIQGIGMAPVYNKFGAVERFEKVDYVRFNNEKKLLVLPKQTRSIETGWEKGDMVGDFSAYVEVDIGKNGVNGTKKSESVAFSIKEDMEGDIGVDKSVYFKTPIEFTVTVKNTGTAKLKTPQAAIEIYNIFGAKIDTLEIDVGTDETIEKEGQAPVTIKKLSSGEEQVIKVAYDKMGYFGLYKAKLVGGKNMSQTFDTVPYLAGSIVSMIIELAGLLVLIFILMSFAKTYMRMKKKLEK